MIIDNIDALKLWLGSSLSAITDADPATLARYVLALLKKDKPLSELREICISQLDVFLKAHTTGFVDKLLAAVESKSYLHGLADRVPVIEPIAAPLSVDDRNAAWRQQPTVANIRPSREVPALAANAVNIPLRRRSHSRSPVDSGSRKLPVMRKRSHSRSPPTNVRKRSRSRSPLAVRRRSRSPVPAFRRRSISRSPVRSRFRRSRSRSPGLRRRSRSPDRRPDRYRDGRPWSRPERTDRFARSRSPSPASRARHRSRSPGKRPDINIQEQKLSSKDGSEGTKQESAATGKPSDTAAASRQRCRDYDEKGFCLRGDLCQFDHGTDPVVVDDLSTLPYNPGSSSVPASARPPPVSAAAPSLSVPVIATFPAVNAIDTLRPPPPIFNRDLPPPGMLPSVVHLPPPASLPYQPRLVLPPTVPDRSVPPPPLAGQTEAYNPEAPAIKPAAVSWPPQTILRGAYPPLHPPHLLGMVPPVEPVLVGADPAVRLPVPPLPVIPDAIVSVPGPRPFAGHARGGRSFSHRQRFDYNRLGSRRPIKTENSTLEIRKIPVGLNKMDTLLGHFKTFGTVVNLQICYEGDPEAALVSFATHSEALAAHQSSAPVLNNRFIKVFWHNKQQQQQTPADVAPAATTTEQPTTQPQSDNGVVVSASSVTNVHKPTTVAAKDRVLPKAHQLSLNNVKRKTTVEPATQESVSSAVAVATKTPASSETGRVRKSSSSGDTAGVAPVTSTGEATAAPAPTVTHAPTRRLNARQKQQETLKLKLELQKKKQQLLEKQVQQQKLLLAKLEKKTLAANDKADIMKTLKSLTDSVGKLQAELKSAVVTPPTGGHMTRSAATRKVNSTSPVLSPSSTNMSTETPAHTQQTAKVSLDTELDAIQKQFEGADTSELYKKVAELKREAVSLGLLGSGVKAGSAGQGLTTAVSRRRSSKSHTYSGSTLALDNRPTQVSIVGFKLEEKASMLRQLKSFGDVEAFEDDEEERSMVIKYRSRQDAEQAFIEATRAFSDHMTVRWFRQTSESTSSDHDLERLLDKDVGNGDEVEVSADSDMLLLADDD